MGRVKTAPVRLKKTAANLDPPGPRAPRYQHTIWFVEDVSEYWPLGDVWVGRTANVLPPVWKKCGVNFRQLGDDAWSVHLHFDTEELVIVNLTNDVGFIKGILSVRLFSLNVQLRGDLVYLGLYLRELPLEKFNASTGHVMKTVFALLYNVKLENAEIDINNAAAKELPDLYKNLNDERKEKPPLPDVKINYYRLKPSLRPYQEHAVRWMINREQEITSTDMLHPLYREVTLPNDKIVYFNQHTGYIETTKPLVKSLQTGGILADEMGLGKTIEVLACILTNTREELVETAKIPDYKVCINRQQKRKITNVTAPSGNYIDRSKKVKIRSVNKNGAKRSGKSKTYEALNMWYQSVLSTTVAKPLVNTHNMECICGGTDRTDAVCCVDCGKEQHATCLGYNKQHGCYRCPQCWINQPLLESNATLIVCPASLKRQWTKEIMQQVSCNLNVLIYEGKSATPIYPIDIQKNYHIVITTYNVLQSELRLSDSTQRTPLRNQKRYSVPGCSLVLINWWRLCLDEAQTVEMPNHLVSTMASKLQACHRWAVTGTPASETVADLFGLINYLHMEPYSEEDTWKYLLYLPYLKGNKEPMHKFLAEVLWRTAKCDVLDQINIPEQTFKEYVLEFSAVELFYYQMEHESCTNDFLKKLRNHDPNLQLSTLDRHNLKKILMPLSALRQACNHPNTRHGRYLARSRDITSIGDLLEVLIGKVLTDCEENMRVIISSLNGRAGIYLLLQNPRQAIEEYRKVLQISADFTPEKAKTPLSIDKLQLIHTMHNLAEVIVTCTDVGDTLRDHRLKEDCAALQDEYLQKYIKQTIKALMESRKITSTVDKWEAKFKLKPGQWYSDLLDWVMINNLMDDLSQRIASNLESAAYTTDAAFTKFNSERKIRYCVSTWDEDVTTLKYDLVTELENLYHYDKNSRKITISDGLVNSAMACHLRPEKHSKVQKCKLCRVNDLLTKYESRIFNTTQRKNDDVEVTTVSNKGNWKPTPEELVLKALLNIANVKLAEKQLLAEGAIYMKWIRAKKDEFKELRRFWTFLDQQISAQDEVEICKTRLRLKPPQIDDDVYRKPTKSDKVLKNLSMILENKLETVHMLEEHELDYQQATLLSEENRNMDALQKNLGTHSYLLTLRGQQSAGQSPDPCPICKNELTEHWNILECGHCYCLQCMQQLLSKATFYHILCSVCRQSQHIDKILYTRLDADQDGDQKSKFGIKIRGNYSAKLEGIIKAVLSLKQEDESVKVLAFSSMPDVLKILKEALIANGVKAIVPSGNANVLDVCVDKFKDPEEEITVLLLPVHFGARGLNLIEATQVILIEPLLNPADELQAIGRVHRIGQTKPTRIHRFVIKDTIEQSIYKSDNWDIKSVTLGQLRDLFLKSDNQANANDVSAGPSNTHQTDMVDTELTQTIGSCLNDTVPSDVLNDFLIITENDAEISDHQDNTASSEVLIEAGLTGNAYSSQFGDSLNDTGTSYISNESEESETPNSTYNESLNETETMEHKYAYDIDIEHELCVDNTEQT